MTENTTQLRRTDVNGREIVKGSRVETPHGPATVLLVEMGMRGGRNYREGMGTFYVNFDEATRLGSCYSFRADQLRVLDDDGAEQQARIERAIARTREIIATEFPGFDYA